MVRKLKYTNNWKRFTQYLFVDEQLGLQVDISRIIFSDDLFSMSEPMMKDAFEKIKSLEKGVIANPDENRMVGHYWLRNPEMAPDPSIAAEIRKTITDIKKFVFRIHAGEIHGESGHRFRNVLVVGIGGSSLGPRFVSEALYNENDKMRLFFIDNTDPDGMDRILTSLNNELDITLVIIISKSGGTIETRNGMEEVRRFYCENGLDFGRHALSVTQQDSLLDRISTREGWLANFPMWDWVGGRTSVLSAVGLLPLALQGVDIDFLLQGARKCDEVTRTEETTQNPSALLALMWYACTEGRGGKQMVMLPYKDRLELLTKYLQQLIMESLGKGTDLDGNEVKQGITVLGNKGSTDQHSYLQQLLDGPDNFFVTFVEVLKDRARPSMIIADGNTSGDYLHAFLMGTRKALTEKGKQSLTITIRQVDEFSLGVLLALYERAVSIYAYMVNINAYHQPAVELGKKSAGDILTVKNKVVNFLTQNRGKMFTLDQIATNITVDQEDLFKVLQHVANNPDHNVKMMKENKDTNIFEYKYLIE